MGKVTDSTLYIYYAQNKLIYIGILLGKVTDSTHYIYFAQNKLIYMGILLGKVTDSTLYIHKDGGRRSIVGIKERFERNSLKFDFLNFDPKNEKRAYPKRPFFENLISKRAFFRFPNGEKKNLCNKLILR